MTVWKTPLEHASTETPFVFRWFRATEGLTIDMEDSVLQDLVELFVKVQLNFWEEINRVASFRFPGRPVAPYITQVEEFLERDEDGFIRLFGEYIAYFMVLNHISGPNTPCTQKRPHLKPREPYLDHLAAWKRDDNEYRLLVTEVKTTKSNARNLVRGKVFPEFKEIENGLRDRDLTAEINAMDWYFLENRDEVKALVDSLFWKESMCYQAFVVSTDCGPDIFGGYEANAAKNPDNPRRRWATVVPISNWDAWVNRIKCMTKSYIAIIKVMGCF